MKKQRADFSDRPLTFWDIREEADIMDIDPEDVALIYLNNNRERGLSRFIDPDDLEKLREMAEGD